jgi:hypothetical protein
MNPKLPELLVIYITNLELIQLLNLVTEELHLVLLSGIKKEGKK